MPAVYNTGQGNQPVPTPNRGALASTGRNPNPSTNQQAPPSPVNTPSPSTSTVGHPVFNRALYMQYAQQQREANPGPPVPATTSGYVPSEGPAQYALRNPLSAKTLLGGFEIAGQDVQNFFAGSATGYSELAQNASSNPNPVVRANLAPLFYGLAGFEQSFGTLTGKYGRVPVNPYTVTGFGIGLGTQAFVGGEAYGAAKGALFGGTELTQAGPMATRGLISAGGLGRIGSIAFGAGFWGSFSAGLSALQGAKPAQIAESGLIGAGLGAGGEFLAQFVIPKFTGRAPPSSAGKAIKSNVSFLRTTGSQISSESGSGWIETGYGDIFYTRAGQFTYVPKNIAPYTGTSIVPKFPDILPEGIVPIEEGGGGDIGPSPFVRPQTGVNRIFPEGTSKPLDFNDLVGKFSHPESVPETGRVVSNPNPDIGQDVIDQVRSSNVPKEVRTREGYSLLQTEPPLKGYEQGYTMLTVSPYEEIDLRGARASSLGIGGNIRNLFKTPKAFQPTLGGVQTIPSQVGKSRARTRETPFSISIPSEKGLTDLITTPNVTPTTTPVTSIVEIPTTTPTSVPKSLDLLQQDQLVEVQEQEVASLRGRSVFPPLLGLMGPTAKPAKRKGRKRYREGQRRHHLSENIVTGEGVLSVEDFLKI